MEVENTMVGEVVSRSDEGAKIDPSSFTNAGMAMTIHKWLTELPLVFHASQESLWRTLVAQSTHDRKRISWREFEVSDKAGWDAMMSADETLLASGNDIINDYVYTIYCCLLFRCLCVCPDGRIGLGSSKIQTGNKFVVLL
jgi:hypothetical protein